MYITKVASVVYILYFMSNHNVSVIRKITHDVFSLKFLLFHMKMHKNNSIEKYLEDTINEYLRSQQELTEYDTDYEEPIIIENNRDEDYNIVEELISDLLYDVDRAIIFQESYKKAQKDHHQYALFELEDVLPGFHISKS
ncbi:uncharacterized protein LOC143193006 [Rhynchophorus ferrugineus]|uniref:uncharacterized protein LOC143193006 n=1 Tax=Rhynchophorus ferrugineus TaxID=354439 RepID=UPI003FCDCF33